jgi:hypothetical protein
MSSRREHADWESPTFSASAALEYTPVLLKCIQNGDIQPV